MKTRSDPRHQARVAAVKKLFEIGFQAGIKPEKETLAESVIARKKQIDGKIAKNAPAWPLGQVAPIDLAVLRVAVFELLYKSPKEPYKVIIDEAVEIAKEYGSESSPSFVNGVLGSIVKSTKVKT
jgi:N utilization substance protein B